MAKVRWGTEQRYSSQEVFSGEKNPEKDTLVRFIYFCGMIFAHRIHEEEPDFNCNTNNYELGIEVDTISQSWLDHFTSELESFPRGFKQLNAAIRDIQLLFAADSMKRSYEVSYFGRYDYEVVLPNNKYLYFTVEGDELVLYRSPLYHNPGDYQGIYTRIGVDDLENPQLLTAGMYHKKDDRILSLQHVQLPLNKTGLTIRTAEDWFSLLESLLFSLEPLPAKNKVEQKVLTPPKEEKIQPDAFESKEFGPRLPKTLHIFFSVDKARFGSDLEFFKYALSLNDSAVEDDGSLGISRGVLSFSDIASLSPLELKDTLKAVLGRDLTEYNPTLIAERLVNSLIKYSLIADGELKAMEIEEDLGYYFMRLSVHHQSVPVYLIEVDDDTICLVVDKKGRLR